MIRGMRRSAAGGGEEEDEEEEEEEEDEEEVAAAVAGATALSPVPPPPPPIPPGQAPLRTAPQLPGVPRRLYIALSDARALSLPALAFLLLQASEPHDRELTRAAQASRARRSFARVLRRRPPLDAGALPPPPVAEAEHTTGSSISGGEEEEEPLLAAVACSFEGVFAVVAAAAAAVVVRSERAELSFAAAAPETEGDAEGLMLQVLPPPPAAPRCGVE